MNEQELCERNKMKLAEEFKECQNAFVALGDETRQNIIIALLESPYEGIRVGEITKKTHLSRPAVSHHLKILRETGIISMTRKGTKNYYYVNAAENQWRKLTLFMNHIYDIVKNLPKCSREDTEDDF